MSLSQRAAKGIVWAYSAYMSGRLMTLLSTAILARPACIHLILNFESVIRTMQVGGINPAPTHSALSRGSDLSDP